MSVPTYSWSAHTAIPTNQWRLHTDQRGMVIFHLPPAAQQQFILLVQHTNYARVGAQWYSRTMPVMEQVPANFTFTLEPGDTIGGMFPAASSEEGAP